MEAKLIRGNSEEEIWQQLRADLSSESFPFEYYATIYHGGKEIGLSIDIDPGGGFEGGYELTSIKAPIPIQFTNLSAAVDSNNQFRFALHHESVIDKVGNFFGMEDVLIGYPEFDEQLIVKTNDVVKVREVFSSNLLRIFFQSFQDFTLHITHHSDHDEKKVFLELEIDRGITDTAELQRIYSAFFAVLTAIDKSPVASYS